MGGAQSAAGVAMKVFVEEHIVLEMRIVRQLGMVLENRPPAVVVFEKEPGQPPGQFLATWLMVMNLPEPVGHSILKSSP